MLTSSTIGNPAELAEKLIEAPVELIDEDGSAQGERHFIIYNPPVTDTALGMRKSSLMESIRLAGDLLLKDVQSVVFARSRRSVEIILTHLRENRKWKVESRENTHFPLSTFHSPKIRGYRSGYLPSQRREIEKGLRDGNVRLVASPNPLDQFLAHHPEYFFSRSPEQALINPDHLLILLNHLRCAAFELPFKEGQGFGNLPAESLSEFLAFLAAQGQLHASKQAYFWMADAYPAASVSLRSASPENVILQIHDGGIPRTLGEVDLASATWMVHPRALYLHEGQQYFVQELDLAQNIATLIPVALDYFTQPQRQTEVTLLSKLADSPLPLLGEGLGVRGVSAYGELLISEQVTAFRKRSWETGENLGEETLELPPKEFQTTGYWLSLSD